MKSLQKLIQILWVDSFIIKSIQPQTDHFLSKILKDFITKGEKLYKKIVTKYLHIESEFEFGFSVGVVDLEETVHEFFQVNVAAVVQVKNSKEALANNSGQTRILKNTNQNKH